MNLADMRARVEEFLGISGDLTATELDEQMNLLWRFEIPGRLGGLSTFSFFEFSTVDGTQDYDLDVEARAQSLEIRTINEPIIDTNNGRVLRFTDQPQLFWTWHDLDTTTNGRPISCLLMGRVLTLRHIPDATVYTIRVHGSFYRAALASAGLPDESEAWCVIAGSALRFVQRKGLGEETKQRAIELYETQFDLVFAKYHGGSGKNLTQDQMPANVYGADF